MLTYITYILNIHILNIYITYHALIIIPYIININTIMTI